MRGNKISVSLVVKKIYIHTYIFTVVGYRHNDLNSNPQRGCLAFIMLNTNRKDMNRTIIPLIYGKIIGQSGLFDLVIATGQREGKL